MTARMFKPVEDTEEVACHEWGRELYKGRASRSTVAAIGLGPYIACAR